MSTPECATPGCGHPAHDGFVCRNCVDQVRRDLRAIDKQLADDLLVTMARWDETGIERTREPGLDPLPTDQPIAETPLPYHPPAGQVLGDMHRDLGMWVRVVAGQLTGWPLDADMTYQCMGATPHRRLMPGEGTGPVHGPWRPIPLLPRDTPRELAKWLGRYLETLKGCADAGEIVAGIGRHVAAAKRIIYPEPFEYAGPCNHCTCGVERCRKPYGAHGDPVDLYAPRTADTVTCPHCRVSYPMAERRKWLLEQARQELMTATEASRALSGLLADTLPEGKKLTAAMIRGWAARGKIAKRPPHPRDVERGRTDPRYVVGELIDKCREMAEEDADRGQKRRKATEPA